MPTSVAFYRGIVQPHEPCCVGLFVWHACPVDQEQELRDALKRAVALRKRGQKAERDAIVAALRGGLRQVDVMHATGRSREHIRRVARSAGIESDRPTHGKSVGPVT